MEPSLVVIGLSYKTAPVAVRERFWLNEARRHDALHQLIRSEGVDEAIVLATCNRTEFIIWASDASEAANSVLRFLTREFDLKLCEWSHFYRLIDEPALLQVFRVASGLDCISLGDPAIADYLRDAWLEAQKAGTTGRFLDAVMQKAIFVAHRVRSETGIGEDAVSLPYACVDLTKEIFGSLENAKVLLLGAGKMGELAARYLKDNGAREIAIASRTFEHAAALAANVGANAVSFDQRLASLKDADIVVSTAFGPDYILTGAEADSIMRERETRPMVIIDMAVPRSIDPDVRDAHAVFLYDMDHLEDALRHQNQERRPAAMDAEEILLEEAQGFRRKLLAEQVVPTITALRSRLEQICGQELDTLREQYGPFTEDQSQALAALASHITQRIAASLARELKNLPERAQQDALTDAVQRLFQLEIDQSIAPLQKSS